MTYSEYKSSGVDWIDDVPTDWFITPNKYLFVITKDLVGDKSNEYQLLSLTQKGVIFRDIESGKGKFPAKFDSYQVVQENNLIFCLFDIEETPRAVGISKHFGMITGAYTVVVCNNRIEPKFLYYYYLQMDNDKRLKPYYTGLRNTVRTDTFLSLKVPHPPLQEQQQIANFLDHKTQQVDSLIEKTQQKIELLKEQRTALVNQVVTKGLDPDAEMKDSGVEWIGEIPAGWRVKKVKHVIKPKGLVRGPFGSALKTDTFVPSGYKVYEQKNAIYGQSNLGKSYVTKSKYEELIRFSVKTNDFIMSCSGTIGRTHLFSESFEEGIINQALLIIRFDLEAGINLFYMSVVMDSWWFQKSILDNSQGSAMKNLVGIEIFKNIKLPIPPPQEQQEIVEFLDQKTQQIDSQVEKETKRIKLLKEYRNSLISEVVTGKIDVREEMVA